MFYGASMFYTVARFVLLCSTYCENSVHLNSNIWPFFVQVNPFKDRICKVFSSSKDGELTFEDFLDMMSVFSENVSLQAYLKTTICFSISQCFMLYHSF